MIVNNEIKIKDLPESHLQSEVGSLYKEALLDYGLDMDQETFSRDVTRISYQIRMRYKSLMLGEVKYVFDAMIEQIKGKLSVAEIMKLFGRYNEQKIEKQKQQREELDIDQYNDAVNCLNSPLGSAIIHKIDMVERGELKKENWDDIKLKDLAEKIKSGEIKTRKNTRIKQVR